MSSMKSVIHAKGLKIGYSESAVLGQIEKLDIQQGEIVSIIGESGIGKTTFLKTIANLIKPIDHDKFLNFHRLKLIVMQSKF